MKMFLFFVFFSYIYKFFLRKNTIKKKNIYIFIMTRKKYQQYKKSFTNNTNVDDNENMKNTKTNLQSFKSRLDDFCQ